MTRMDHEVRCMALRQLETACLLYEQQDYYSVITLAGAAEEIFENLLLNKLLEELQPLLISSSGDPLGQLPEEIQGASSELAEHLKELTAKTAQISKAPEETWDESPLLSDMKRTLRNLKTDCKRLAEICIEKLPRPPKNRRRQRSPVLDCLGAVFRRYESSSESLIEAQKKLQRQGGEEPTESAVRRRFNWVRNRLKHWSPGQPQVVEFDAAAAAKDMLDRASDHYYALTGKEIIKQRRSNNALPLTVYNSD